MEISNNDLVLILKNAGTSCNIGCKYCAEARKKYVRHSCSSIVTMEDVDKLIDLTRDVDNVTVLFHGGEPLLLPIAYYDEIISKWREQRSDVYFGFQTNATLINDEWLSFFDQYRDVCGISISLDGDEISNSNRVTKEGHSTFQDVINSLIKLNDKHLNTGMISTLTKSSLERERELFSVIKQFPNIRFLKLNPCYDMWSDGSIPEWSILPSEYAKFVINFFEILYRNRYLGKINVEPILSIVKSIEGLNNSFCNFCDNKCNHFLSVYPEGKIIGCDNFSLEDGLYPNLYSVDSITGLLNNKPQPLFSQLDELQERCSYCNYQQVCHGGCLAVRRRYFSYGQNNEYENYCLEMKRMINYLKERIESVRLLNEDY